MVSEAMPHHAAPFPALDDEQLFAHPKIRRQAAPFSIVDSPHSVDRVTWNAMRALQRAGSWQSLAE